MKHYDIYAKCEECGTEHWWEIMDDMDLGCPYEIGDTDTDFCSKCNKKTTFEVTEINEEDWPDEEN